MKFLTVSIQQKKDLLKQNVIRTFTFAIIQEYFPSSGWVDELSIMKNVINAFDVMFIYTVKFLLNVKVIAKLSSELYLMNPSKVNKHVRKID